MRPTIVVSLLFGIVLGSLSVLFVLQNTAVVTVQFLSWDLTAPLAVTLLGTLLSGIVATPLTLPPSVMLDEMRLATLRRENKILADQLALVRGTAQPATV